MGLAKAIAVPSSLTMPALYWRVFEYSVVVNRSCQVTLWGYWSIEDRQAERQPAAIERVTLNDPPPEMTVEWIYQQVPLQSPKFAGAQAV